MSASKGKPRPRWREGFREYIKERQGCKCAACGEMLGDKYELHHDYEGYNWARIRDITDSEELSLLLTENQRNRAHEQLYHEEQCLQAMHPECHKTQDFWQQKMLEREDAEQCLKR